LPWRDPTDGSPREVGSIKAFTDTPAEPRKIPLKYLVVDHAEKIPIDN
jgi:hypothetical protein